MDPITIAAGIGAISNLAGGLIGSSGQASANAANNQTAWQMAQFNAGEAQKNRDFQERLSNSAYQRAMADMRAAGLNPILAYQQGGAGTPGGGQASGTAAHFENAMAGLGHGVTSAGKAAETAIQLQNVQANTAATKATAAKTAAEEGLAIQNTNTSASTARNNDANTALTMEQMKNPEALRGLWANQGASAKAQADQTNQYGPHWSGGVLKTGDVLYDRLKNVGDDLKKVIVDQVEEHNRVWDKGMDPLKEGWDRGRKQREEFDHRVYSAAQRLNERIKGWFK